MPIFRKRPVEIEAQLWDGDVRIGHAIPAWIKACGGLYTYSTETPQRLGIETLEGVMFAAPGDWIIRGVQGEFYPCKPDIFDKTYEPVSKETPQ